MIAVYVDADACPVKEEVYRVARRHGLHVFVVANAVLQIPREAGIECVVASSRPDAADDWIVEQIGPNDILVTADLPLVDRALKKGARVLLPNGREHTPETIIGALASRAIMEGLRETGSVTGGPAAFGPRDRSRFLGELERIVRAARKAGERNSAG